MGAAGRRRVEDTFRLDDTIRKYWERYAAAAAGRRGVPVNEIVG
jgi:hypothetical protein